MTKAALEELINDVYDLGERIKTVDGLLENLHDAELKKTYTLDMLDLVQLYKDLTALLEHELQVYIREEMKTGNAVTFRYRKILNQLKK